jgi:hypothetical protein
MGTGPGDMMIDWVSPPAGDAAAQSNPNLLDLDDGLGALIWGDAGAEPRVDQRYWLRDGERDGGAE